MNLICVMMDSLRTDYVGAYAGGAAKAKTPNLDRFAEQSLTFENACVGSFPTLPCRRALFTGRWGHPFHPWDDRERVSKEARASPHWPAGVPGRVRQETKILIPASFSPMH